MKRCPDDYLGRWFSILHRMSLRQITQGLREHNIGSGQIMFLLELYHSDGVRQEELSTLLNIDGANTTRAISKLEAEGYVVRRPDKQDGRALRVFLTEQALAIQPQLFALMRSWEERLLRDLSTEEQQQFISLLKKIGHSMSDYDRCIFCDFGDDCQ